MMDWTLCSARNCDDLGNIYELGYGRLKLNRLGVFSNFNEMRKNAVMTDAVLKCDATEFPVHKCFLASTSEYFYAMFTCGLQETTENIIEFQNIDPKAMNTVLNFLYLDSLEFEQEFESVCNLLHALHLFMLHNAFKDCRSTLVSLLSEATYRITWDIGLQYDDKVILKAVELFICRKATEISMTEDIVNLEVCQISRLIECFENMVSYHSAELINIIFKWVEFDMPNRITHLPSFFSKINLKKLSPELMEFLVNHSLIKGNTELVDLIHSESVLTPRSYSNINQTLRLQIAVLGRNQGQKACDMFVYSLHWDEWTKIKLPQVELEVNEPCPRDDRPFCGFSGAIYDSQHSRLIVVNKNTSNCIVDINECLFYPEESHSEIKITKFQQNTYYASRILIDGSKIYVAGILDLDESSSSESDIHPHRQLSDTQLIFKEMDLDHFCPLWKTITTVDDGIFSHSSMLISFIKNGMELWLLLVDWVERNQPLLHCFKVRLDSSDQFLTQSQGNEEMYYNVEVPFIFSDTEFLIQTVAKHIFFKKKECGGYIFDMVVKKFFHMLPMENEPRNIINLSSSKEALWAIDRSKQIYFGDFRTKKWEKLCRVPDSETFIVHKLLISET